MEFLVLLDESLKDTEKSEVRIKLQWQEKEDAQINFLLDPIGLFAHLAKAVIEFVPEIWARVLEEHQALDRLSARKLGSGPKDLPLKQGDRKIRH